MDYIEVRDYVEKERREGKRGFWTKIKEGIKREKIRALYELTN